ncbi:MAG: helix-turn-helix transcriptional regulator [Lachnospiraceae bacterium]|nr:helix-turn-helix transcriptional regulator [Lachnospiraceae bacterium]
MAFGIRQKTIEAKKSIHKDYHNITRISELLGYTSIHHFTRMFKRITGISPTAYKTSVRM